MRYIHGWYHLIVSYGKWVYLKKSCNDFYIWQNETNTTENQKVSFTMMKIHFSLQLENAQLYDLSAVKEIACSGWFCEDESTPAWFAKTT